MSKTDPLSQTDLIAKLRSLSREGCKQEAGCNTPTPTRIEGPRADVRRVDSVTRAYDLPGLMRQREFAPIVTRTRGRLGQGERMLAPAPRLGDGIKHPVTTWHTTENGDKRTVRNGRALRIAR